MRESRTSGSEGGAPQTNAVSLPLSRYEPKSVAERLRVPNGHQLGRSSHSRIGNDLAVRRANADAFGYGFGSGLSLSEAEALPLRDMSPNP
jgi:hypothetical protein